MLFWHRTDNKAGIGFYLLSDKINKSLQEIHEPVPYFNEKLLVGVERALKRFKPHEPFERTSWEIVDDKNLFWRKSYMSAVVLACAEFRILETILPRWPQGKRWQRHYIQKIFSFALTIRHSANYLEARE